MASITTCAEERRRRAWSPRAGALPVALLIVAPLLGLIFAAVYFGMRARLVVNPLSAADVAAAPVRRADPGTSPNRGLALVAALRPTIGGILTGAAAIAVGVVLAVTAAGGSFAFLNSARPLGSGTVTLTAGSLGLSVNGTTQATAVALPATFSKLLPGDYYAQTITLANTGNTRGAVTARIAAASAPYDVRISATACPATGYGTTASGTSLTTADVAVATLTGGASVTGCLLIGLSATAPTTTNSTATVSASTASANFALTFTATQA